jgi:hypothetical protein
MTGRCEALVLACLVLTLGRDPVVKAQASFPPRLEDYFTKILKLTPDERTRLQAGAPVARNIDADPSKEVAIFGAIWIAAPAAKYVAALQDIENFEKGEGFRATKKIGEPARVEDFAALTLPDDDVKDLKACKVGDCELKLSEAALLRVRKEVDWSKPDAKAQLERLIRVMGAEYVNAYRTGGNAELAVYRDSERPTFVANEFREMVNGMPEFSQYLTDMRQYLLEYPKPQAKPTASFIYWQEAAFGLKPTIRISHVAIQEEKDATIVASKQLYSSHYFWTALELRALVPDPSRGTGFWFVNVNRSRSDGLSGFVGRMIRGKVRDAARKGIESGLTAAKKKLEAH